MTYLSDKTSVQKEVCGYIGTLAKRALCVGVVKGKKQYNND